MTKKNVKSLRIIGGFVVFALLNVAIISGIFGISLNSGLVYGYGGGGGSLSMDVCPNGDNSPSFYDGLCGTTKVVTVVSSGEVENNLLNQNDTELTDAYTFAHTNGLTTMATIDKADMGGKLTRMQMAKMIVNYALNVLKKTPDTKADCSFVDTSKQSAEMKTYAIKACQLGLMGIGTTTFMPTAIVTRAQLATVLSRMLYGTANSGTPYYAAHLTVLKNKGVITDATPSLVERRAYLMIMLMRAAK